MSAAAEGDWRSRMEATTVVRPLGDDFDFEVPTRHGPWFASSGFDPLTTAVFGNAAALSETVLDIGAHMGWYAVNAALRGTAARIIAVEGSPANSEVLRRNVERVGGGIEVVTAVMGDVRGDVDFHLTEASDNNSQTGHPDSPTIATITVPAITGDDLDIEGSGDLLVKIDVEGHEVAVLNGMAQLIESRTVTRLIVEVNPECLDLAGTSTEAMWDWLHDHGFSCALLDDRQQLWARIRSHDDMVRALGESIYANLYCVRGAPLLAASLLLHSGGLDGAERTTLDQIRVLLRAGHLVEALIPDHGGLTDQLTELAVPAHRVRNGRWTNHQAEDWACAAHGVEEIAGRWAISSPDVVATITGTTPSGALAAAALGMPHVWALHEYLDPAYGAGVPFAPRDLGSFVEAFSARVITTTPSVAEHLLPHPGEAVTVPPILGGLARSAPSSDLAVPVRLGVIGAVLPGKGQTDLIRASALLAERGVHTAVHVFGDGLPAEVQRVRELAAQVGRTESTTFHGFVRDRDEIYGSVDIVVVASIGEAFGRIPFEAAAAGRPVVYARSGGLLDYMTDGMTGVGFEPGDVSSLAAAVERLIKDGDLREALSRQSYESLLEWLAGHDPEVRWLRTLEQAANAPATRGFVQETAAALVSSAARDLAERRQEDEAARASLLDSVAQWRGHAQGMEHRYEDLSAQHAALQRINAAAHEALTESRADLARLQDECHELARVNTAAHDALAELRTDHAAASKRLAEISAALEAATDELAAIHGSRAWQAVDRLRRQRARITGG